MVTRSQPFSRPSALREGIIFLATFLVAAVVLYFVLSPFETNLQKIEANQTQSILNAVGVDTTPAGNPIQFWMNGKLIEISALCSGLLEMILLASAILATPTATPRKKILGIIIGVAILYMFNLFRIAVTLLQLEHASFSFAELTHDVLFRLILIVGFAALYGAWLNFDKVRIVLRQRGIF